MDGSTRVSKAFRGFAGETADARRDRNFSMGKRGLPRRLRLRRKRNAAMTRDWSARRARIDVGQKERDPAMPEPYPLILFQVRPDRHRYRSRRHPSIAKTNRSEEHTSELQSLMRISYAVFCLTKKTKN